MTSERLNKLLVTGKEEINEKSENSLRNLRQLTKQHNYTILAIYRLLNLTVQEPDFWITQSIV